MNKHRPTVSAVVVCTVCGTEFPIQRGENKKQREGHIKHVYCHICKEVTAHKEKL